MAVSVARLDSGNDDGTVDFPTANINWNGGVGLLFVAHAYDVVGSSKPYNVTATHSTDTWTQASGDGDRQYGTRRGFSLLTCPSPTDGVIDIVVDNNGSSPSFNDAAYVVLEVSGSDGNVPSNIDFDYLDSGTESGPQPSSWTLSDTIDTDDLAIMGGACEGTAGHAVVSSVSLITGALQTSSNCRSVIVGETTDDASPQHDWSGPKGNATLALVFNVGAAGGLSAEEILAHFGKRGVDPIRQM